MSWVGTCLKKAVKCNRDLPRLGLENWELELGRDWEGKQNLRKYFPLAQSSG